MTASEGQQIADLTCKTLIRIRNSDAFDHFWDKVLGLQRKYGIDDARLPRRKKIPRHLEIGSGESFYPSTVKEFYSQQYFECLDFVSNAIKDRFDQPGYKTLQQLENLLIKAARGELYTEELAYVTAHYTDDIMPSSLSAQLEILTTAFVTSTEKPTLGTIKSHILLLTKS